MYAVRTWDDAVHKPQTTVDGAIAYARSYLWRTCDQTDGLAIYDTARCDPDGSEVHMLVLCEGSSENRLPFWAEVYPVT